MKWQRESVYGYGVTVTQGTVLGGHSVRKVVDAAVDVISVWSQAWRAG